MSKLIAEFLKNVIFDQKLLKSNKFKKFNELI